MVYLQHGTEHCGSGSLEAQHVACKGKLVQPFVLKIHCLTERVALQTAETSTRIDRVSINYGAWQFHLDSHRKASFCENSMVLNFNDELHQYLPAAAVYTASSALSTHSGNHHTSEA
jgi:hypothetical protein